MRFHRVPAVIRQRNWKNLYFENNVKVKWNRVGAGEDHDLVEYITHYVVTILYYLGLEDPQRLRKLLLSAS